MTAEESHSAGWEEDQPDGAEAPEDQWRCCPNMHSTERRLKAEGQYNKGRVLLNNVA
jgi:hypothetical protein